MEVKRLDRHVMPKFPDFADGGPGSPVRAAPTLHTMAARRLPPAIMPEFPDFGSRARGVTVPSRTAPQLPALVKPKFPDFANVGSGNEGSSDSDGGELPSIKAIPPLPRR